MSSLRNSSTGSTNTIDDDDDDDDDKVHIKNQQQSIKQCTEDTWVDVLLDWLREHRMPFYVEFIMAWIVAISCLIYYGISYIFFGNNNNNKSNRRILRVPLVSEDMRWYQSSSLIQHDDNSNIMKVYQKLIEKQCTHDHIIASLVDENNDNSNETRQMIIDRIHSDIELRRLVSRFVLLMDDKIDATITTTTKSNIDNDTNDTITKNMEALYRYFDNIWIDLLQFPANNTIIDNNMKQNNVKEHDDEKKFIISLIIPVYRERNEIILRTLDHALQTCYQPNKVQIIISNASSSYQDYDNIQKYIHTNHSIIKWGQLLIINAVNDNNNTNNLNNNETTGRGMTLNIGAKYAKGIIYTFLHSDTLLPIHWDRKVQETLLQQKHYDDEINNNNNNDNNHNTKKKSSKRIIQACAFSLGHNTKQLDGMTHPWGISSVTFLGNLRAYCYNLPYGDHIISIPANYFNYIGGYPNRVIMEDYDIMDLLRKRAKVLQNECISIIPPPTGKCSVRRWQAFGVAYVTLVNALLVHRYVNCGWSTKDVFDYYYQRPNRTDKKKQS